MRAHSWDPRPTPWHLQHDVSMHDVQYRHLSRDRVEVVISTGLRARQVAEALTFAPAPVTWTATTEREHGRRRTIVTAWPASSALAALRADRIRTTFTPSHAVPPQEAA